MPIDKKFSQSLQFLFGITKYVIHNRFKTLIWYLLLGETLKISGQLLPQSGQTTFPLTASQEKLSRLVDKIIAQGGHEAITALYMDSSAFPIDTHSLAEKLRLLIYYEAETQHHFNDIYRHEGIVLGVLDLDPKNEIALSLKYLIKYYKGENLEDIPSSTQVSLKYPFSYYIRGIINTKKAEFKNNPTLLLAGLEDLNRAIKTETNQVVRETMYPGFVEMAKNAFATFINDPHYTNIKFFNLEDQYTLNVNEESATNFHHNQGNRFEVEEIKQACALHMPLILDTQVKLSSPFGKLEAPKNKYQPFVLIYKDKYFHLYKATMKANYEMTLIRPQNPDERIQYLADSLTPEFLKLHVTGIISSCGYIATETDSLSYIFPQERIFYDNNKKVTLPVQHKEKINEKTDDFIGYSLSSFFYFLTGLAFFFSVKNFIQKVHRDKEKIKVAESEKKAIGDVILNSLNKTHRVFSVEDMWSLEERNKIKVNVLVGKINKVKTKINISSLRMNFLKKHSAVSEITIVQPGASELYFKKLQSLFGEKNVQLDNDEIIITIDHPVFPREKSYIEENFQNTMETFLSEVIQRSPEIKFSSLSNLIINNNKKIQDSIEGINNFFSKNIVNINQYKNEADSHKNSSSSTVKYKAGEIVALCDVFISESDSLKANDKFSEKGNLKSEDTAQDRPAYSHVDQQLLGGKIYNFKTNSNDIITQQQNLLNLFNTSFTKNITDQIDTLILSANQLNDALNKFLPLITLTSRLEVLENLYKSFSIAKSKPISNAPVKPPLPTSKKRNKNVIPKKMESDTDKDERHAKFLERQQLFKQEAMRKKLEEEEKIKLKEETEEREKKYREKQQEIETLKKDPFLAMLEHQIELLVESQLLNESPKEYDIIKLCSGDLKLHNQLIEGNYKLLTYYSSLIGLIRCSHSVGIIMRRYDKYYLIETKPYITRNSLMHKFYFINLEHLVSGSKEFIIKFRFRIHNLRTNGFPNEPETIAMSGSLFDDDFLEKLNKRKLDKFIVRKKLRYHFDSLCFINRIVTHICSKNETTYENCGLLHQVITGCINAIGNLLNDCMELDPDLYYQIIKEILNFDSMQPRKSKNESIYQEVRIKVGHYFTQKDTDYKKSFFYDPSSDIYKEESPQLLRLICRDTTSVLKNLDHILPRETAMKPTVNEFHPATKATIGPSSQMKPVTDASRPTRETTMELMDDDQQSCDTQKTAPSSKMEI